MPHCPTTTAVQSPGLDASGVLPFDTDSVLDLVLCDLDLSRLCDLDLRERECLCVLCLCFVFFLCDLDFFTASTLSTESVSDDLSIASPTVEFVPRDTDFLVDRDRDLDLRLCLSLDRDLRLRLLLDLDLQLRLHRDLRRID